LFNDGPENAEIKNAEIKNDENDNVDDIDGIEISFDDNKIDRSDDFIEKASIYSAGNTLASLLPMQIFFSIFLLCKFV
jgi:hypothetical protein